MPRAGSLLPALVVVCGLLVASPGCDPSSRARSPSGNADGAAGGGDELIAPAQVRIHPIFSRPKDWTGDGRPDGFEALLEVQDRFGEPTRATGKVIFELFEYRRDYPDVRGRRLVNPWVTTLASVEEQQARWNRALRAYVFPLAFPEIQSDRTYVLTATFERDGGRLFDQLIVEPGRAEDEGVNG